MSHRLPEKKGWLWRRSNKLIELRDRRGWQFVIHWMLLEPAPVKRNTTKRRRKWRR